MKIGGSNEHHSALTGLTTCSEAALLPRSWIRRFNINKAAVSLTNQLTLIWRGLFSYCSLPLGGWENCLYLYFVIIFNLFWDMMWGIYCNKMINLADLYLIVYSKFGLQWYKSAFLNISYKSVTLAQPWQSKGAQTFTSFLGSEDKDRMRCGCLQWGKTEQEQLGRVSCAEGTSLLWRGKWA